VISGLEAAGSRPIFFCKPTCSSQFSSSKPCSAGTRQAEAGMRERNIVIVHAEQKPSSSSRFPTKPAGELQRASGSRASPTLWVSGPGRAPPRECPPSFSGVAKKAHTKRTVGTDKRAALVAALLPNTVSIRGRGVVLMSPRSSCALPNSPSDTARCAILKGWLHRTRPSARSHLAPSTSASFRLFCERRTRHRPTGSVLEI
jgi:hypothetical protein